MDYEKSYKDALERARKIENGESINVPDGTSIPVAIFPELQESQDERIRKLIIKHFKEIANRNEQSWKNLDIPYILSWLEKQGETNIQNNKPFKIESDKFYFCIKDYFAGGCYRSKNGDVVLAKNGMNMMGLSPKEASEYFIPINPFNEDVVAWFEKQRETSQEETVDIANKIRPKFDIGDWITCPGFISAPHMLQVINIGDGLYELEDVYGTKKRSTIGDTESIYDYWTFNDAKEGDVLCYKDFDCVRTFIHKFGKFHYYCCLINDVFVPHSDYFVVQDDRLLSYIRPATKEQRDLFFKNMQESGYEWNAEKKVLKNLKPKFKVGDWIVSANGKVNQVISVHADNVDFEGYTLDDDVYFSGTWCNSYHLWTIKDAKEGDVLAWDDSKCLALFENIYDEDSFKSHGFVGHHTGTFESGSYFHDIEGAHPATIEQHELLFRKIKEEGYQWDKNKKEVIKL